MDLLQREGKYPVPPQAPATMGVEFSGVIEGFGPDVNCDFKVGDEVFGLAYGGLSFLVLWSRRRGVLTEIRCLCGVDCGFAGDAGSQAC